MKGGVLPAYCDPPNPCPAGYTAEDGCIQMEEFENKAEFSRKYQVRGDNDDDNDDDDTDSNDDGCRPVRTACVTPSTCSPAQTSTHSTQCTKRDR